VNECKTGTKERVLNAKRRKDELMAVLSCCKFTFAVKEYRPFLGIL